MSAYIYDIEIYPNGAWFSFIPVTANKEVLQKYIDADIDKDFQSKEQAISDLDIRVFGIFEQRNDLSALVNFINSARYLIGFNNKFYDNLIIDALCIKYTQYSRYESHKICSELFELSQTIINMKGLNPRWTIPMYKKFKATYISIDLLAVLFETNERKSLKQVAINLKWYRIQDLPYHWTHRVELKEERDIIDYNINDILITFQLYWYGADIIKLRIELTKLYEVNLLNANKSAAADLLMSKFYSDATGLKYYEFKDNKTYHQWIYFDKLIDERIKFSHPILVKFLDKLKKIVVNTNNDEEDEFSENLIFNDTAYTFAKGGLHSKDRPICYIPNSNTILRDCDVSSYYPMIVYLLRIAPAHINKEAFLAIAHMVITERIEAKHQGLKTKADGLKIVLNSGIFGKFGFEAGILYDLEALYKVTINGQLFLLMLIEQFEANDIHVFSTNTDGIVVKLPKDKEEIYKKLCDDWCKLVGFELEFTDYAKYVCTGVNSYLAIKPNDSIKAKGEFVSDIVLTKGYNMPIVAIAIRNYYEKGIPIDDTLHNHDNIYDFCISQRIGEQFVPEYHTIVDNRLNKIALQKNIRYYVSTRGGILMKRYKDSNKTISAVANETVVIFNDYFRVKDMKEYNIKYNFYKKECYKLINNINNEIHVKMKKQAGKLFDEL